LLEQEFGIEIPRGELWPESNFRIRPEWVEDGKLTATGLVELRAVLPYADLHSLQICQRPGPVPDLLTVNLLDAYFEWKLNGGIGAKGKACSGRSAAPLGKRSDSARVRI